MKKRSIAEILSNWGKFGIINTIGQWDTLEKGLQVFAIGRATLEASTDQKVYNLVVDTPLFKSLYQLNLAVYDLEFKELLMTVKNTDTKFSDEITEFCHKIVRVFEKH